MIRGYSIKWIIGSVLLGGIAGSFAFMIHASIHSDSGPSFTEEFFIETMTITLAALILAGFFVPVFLLSDFLSKRSNTALAISALLGAIALGTLIMWKKKFPMDVSMFARGWNVYMYSIIMSSFARIGWNRARPAKGPLRSTRN